MGFHVVPGLRILRSMGVRLRPWVSIGLGGCGGFYHRPEPETNRAPEGALLYHVLTLTLDEYVQRTATDGYLPGADSP